VEPKVLEVLRDAHQALEKGGIRHALIGGLAVIAHGYERNTIDVDFLVDGDQRQNARDALIAAGFELFHESNDTLQLCGKGAVDVIFALRPATRGMLAAARPTGRQAIPCVGVEGVIGLKIQAYMNNPKRVRKEQTDIEAMARANPALDWGAVKRYADVFGQWPTIEKILREASPGR
jgi:hypothetical protein